MRSGLGEIMGDMVRVWPLEYDYTSSQWQSEANALYVELRDINDDAEAQEEEGR